MIQSLLKTKQYTIPSMAAEDAIRNRRAVIRLWARNPSAKGILQSTPRDGWRWIVVEGKALPTIWDVPDDLWERIEPVILELDPPKARGRAKGRTSGRCWKASSFGCEAVASGTTCPGSWEMIAPSTGPSNAGWSLECWRASGLFLVEGCEELGGVDWEWQSADCSMGKARFGGGGRDWTQPHRPGQSWEQEEHRGRRGRRTPERGGGWSQRP